MKAGEIEVEIKAVFNDETTEILRKLEAPKTICKAAECINYYRTKGATCIRREIVIENGKCKYYEV